MIEILVSIILLKHNQAYLHIAYSYFCATEACCQIVGAETEAYRAQVIIIWPFPEKVGHHCSKLWLAHPISKYTMLSVAFWHLGLLTLGLSFSVVYLWPSQVLSRGVVLSSEFLICSPNICDALGYPPCNDSFCCAVPCSYSQVMPFSTKHSEAPDTVLNWPEQSNQMNISGNLWALG